MKKVTVKDLAEYCRDYIDLISPSVMSRGGKQVRLPSNVLNTEPLLSIVDGINYDDQIILPISLTTKLLDLSLESEEEDIEANKTIARELALARDLDDIHRKFETNSYTKQLSLQFGYISFKGIPNFGEEDDEIEGSYKQAEGYLFSVPIVLKYHDSAGQRTYEVRVDDTFIKTNTGFVKNYMKLEYRDELFKFVAIDANDDNTSIPMSSRYVDELWSKITTYLKFSDAINISETPDMDSVVIALEPKANYFLSQDLSGIIQTANDDVLADTSLSAWVDKEDLYRTEHVSDTGEHELFLPFAYDKHQLQVLSKINNKGLIVEGPPGTGKSQTISNLLVHLAATGKKVLFVSQKDQAVRGVKDKLKTLNISFLFGYMPDRSSRLHTQEDERDSVTFALRGISQSYLDNVSELNPKTFLGQIAEEISCFNGYIEESRTFTQKYNEWSSLDEFEFGANNSKITLSWYRKIQDLRKSIQALNSKVIELQNESDKNSKKLDEAKRCQRIIEEKIQNLNQSFRENHDYEWLKYEQKYIRGIGYEALSNLTQSTISIFETTIIDRRINVFSARLNNMKLSKELNRTLHQLPIELFETYTTIVFSKNTKTERCLGLEDIKDYFLSMAQLESELNTGAEIINQLEQEQAAILHDLTLSESTLGEQNSQLNSELLDDISMRRLERLYETYNNELFDKINRRITLDAEVKFQISINPNKVRENIMREKQEYNSQVKNYIRNRIAERAESFRSKKQYRSALESIAWKLSKTKKAYKTFDRLKSDPFNFEAMSAVTPIWMMGLDDASRILPLKPNLFDYVIIDEASQCNIAYTLPVMYRAKHAILFGDTLQMRDTTIAFKSNNQLSSLALKHSIPEDLQIKAEGDSVKSVMDIAKLSGFETTVLKKHYRSPLELIRFSNDNFYAPKNRSLEVVNDDILATEDGRVLKTHLIQLNPDIEISSKTNLSEAYYIKNLIAHLKSQELTKDKSIAVLSFFNEQAELLRRVISDEDIKISAIEGIQGDERDIVIYSFVISSPLDKRRYIALTGESGEIRKEVNEGRVNVAFSRAKLQVHAVTSLAPCLWPDGIWIKRYLEYIEKHGRVNRLSKSEQQFDSNFEKDVYDFLMQKLDLSCYRITTQVESCGFKIDQVITNIKTGKKLAIECDGPTHFEHGDGQVRVESDFERQYVLETAHWVFYRISYIDWQQHKVTAKQDLMNAITDHFSNEVESKFEVKTNLKDVMYEPIPVIIPETIVDELKQQIKSSTPQNSSSHSSQKKDSTEIKVVHDVSHDKKQKDDGLLREYDIISIIKIAKIPFIDKRNNGGSLWIVGGEELAEFVKNLNKLGIEFNYKPNGGKVTKGQAAWWTK